VQPQQVIEVLNGAGIDPWVLMGLYGYVGYMTQPRATQDVDVLVDESQLEQVVDAIQTRWPTLVAQRFPVVVRFRDPGEISIGGELQSVIDVMIPSNACHAAILQVEHRVDETTGHRIPSLEAAIAAKYAAVVSPHRDWDRKQQDAVDLRNLIIPNEQRIDREKLQQLGELVFSGGGAELLEFLHLALDRKPFPSERLEVRS